MPIVHDGEVTTDISSFVYLRVTIIDNVLLHFEKYMDK